MRKNESTSVFTCCFSLSFGVIRLVLLFFSSILLLIHESFFVFHLLLVLSFIIKTVCPVRCRGFWISDKFQNKMWPFELSPISRFSWSEARPGGAAAGLTGWRTGSENAGGRGKPSEEGKACCCFTYCKSRKRTFDFKGVSCCQDSQSSPPSCYPEGDFRVAQVAQDEVRLNSPWSVLLSTLTWWITSSRIVL